jgi:peptidoglycan/xylan/chitin deacetylase (PgdA/CDA1 family)
VLVLHDDERRGDETAEVLRRVLPELARRGYRVTTLSELAGLAGDGAGRRGDRVAPDREEGR